MIPISELPKSIQTLHQFNALLHEEPIQTIAYGLFWFVLLLGSTPILGFGVLFYTGYQVIRHVTGFRNDKICPKELQQEQSSNTIKLAVLVTGCDSGFGHEIAFSLMSQGFVVFAGCLNPKESFPEFFQKKDDNKIIPLAMDVTNDQQVLEAYTTVETWLEKAENTNESRYLHALINNAGIGIGGLIDWLDISDFQNTMNVNFIGCVRVVKTFLPIFKQQVVSNTYMKARIINVVSTAGIFAGGIMTVAYECSKHAQEAFTTNLRLELKPFGIPVVAITPGSHRSPMIDGKNIANGMRKVWNKLTKEKQNEYGQGMLLLFNICL